MDQQRDVAAAYQITAMPTFIAFRDGSKVQDIRGADPSALEAMIRAL